MAALMLCGSSVGATLLEIPSGSPPDIDGVFRPSEWQDAAIVELSTADERVEVRVHLIHDEEQLYVAFQTGENSDRELVIPEVLIDPDNAKHAEWGDDDWWFHVSAQNCDCRGGYDDYMQCALTRPGWLGRPNCAPDPHSVRLDAIEMRISLSMVPLSSGSPFGLALEVNAWPSDTRGYWPAGASIESPVTWGEAVLLGSGSNACREALLEGSDPFARPVSTAEAEGIDPGLLNAMMEAIRAQNEQADSPDTIDSVIVIRHGNVVLEEYPNPSYPADRLHHLFSVTKSITSLLVGIALDRGWIEAVDVPILDFFPGLLPDDEVGSKSAITLEHLLTMSAGLEWDEDTWPIRDSRNDFGRLESSREPIRYVLGKPLVAPPGELFWYNSGLSHVLSAVVSQVSGMSTLQFARQALFGPLGIEAAYWKQDATGLHKGGTQLYLRPRDLARIGVLCLEGGVWNGTQIVSKAWIEASTRNRIHGRPDYFAGRGYAYHWWTVDEYGVYYASGSQGQHLYVFPDLDLVVVFTATILEGAILPEALTRDYILPAVETDP